MSKTYRAIQLERFAPSFREGTRIVDLPVAAPGPGELLVRNRCCGVNGIFDTQFAMGKAGYMSGALPSFTGVEAAGIVEAVGKGVEAFAPGDAVAASRFRSGYREVNIGPADQFALLPDAGRASLAISSTGVAALLALEHAGRLQDGETVAVSAAAGGLGHFLVQLAKLRGARVVAICGGAEKAAFVRSLGADRVVDYRTEDVAAVLAAEFKDAIDVAVDTVGGIIFDALVSNLAPHARLVVSGAAADMESDTPGPRVSLPIYYKAARIQAFQNGLARHLWPGARKRLFALQAAGALKVRCDEGFYGLESVYDAIDHLTSGRSVGKVAVELGPLDLKEESMKLSPKPAKTDWADFRKRMPQLMESVGVWEGWYRYYDAETGALTDQHRSRLICRIMDEDAEFPYYQTNQYFWEDGRSEVREFPAWYADGRIWWDNALITGWAAPMQPDDFHRTTCLNWTRTGEEGLYLYEMIQHAANGIDRARAWQWFKDDRCWQRTLIDEKRVSRDWKSWTDNGPPKG